jgi:branched-chain amino acid transport system ATP-binding protein
MLEISNLHAFTARAMCCTASTFEVGQGEIVALLGRNGSGRSTTAKAIMGLVDCQGSMTWKGQDILGKKPLRSPTWVLAMCPKTATSSPSSPCTRTFAAGAKIGASRQPLVV